MNRTTPAIAAALTAAAVGATATGTAYAGPAASRTPAAVTAPAQGPALRPAAPACSMRKYATYRGRRLLVAAFCGRRMSDIEMVRVLRKAGWTWTEMPAALATYMGESDGWTQAVHYNRAPNGALRSTDLGWTQINDRWNPAIRHINHADPIAAARLAHRIKQTGGLRQWNAYGLRGRYTKRAAAAINAAHRAGVR